MMSLEDLIAQTPAGGTLDLGNRQFAIGADPLKPYGLRIAKPITIVGSNAIIDVGNSPLRARPGILVLAAAVRIGPGVTVLFPDVGRRDDLEAQHGIELRGAHDCSFGCTIVNPQGTTLYCGKDPHAAPGTGWCHNIATVPGFASVNPGRQHFALQAIDGFRFDAPQLTWCGEGHSSIVFEPNGHDWGCRNGVITGAQFNGHTGFCFAALGLGDHQPVRNLENVRLQSCVSHDTPFEVRIVNGVGNRRGPGLVFAQCEGAGIAHTPVIRCSGTDGLQVTKLHQRMAAGVDVAELHDCPGAFVALA